jgi:hypothetical protein
MTVNTGGRASPLPITGTSTSSSGLASSTSGRAATRAKSASSKPVRAPLTVASACPVTERTAAENSASAAVLIRCTA